MLRCFDADWNQAEFKPDPKSRLIWCPNNGRARIAAFIDSAQHSLWLQNERYQDTVIIERLVRALARGVKVHIMARPPHNLKQDKLIEGVGGLRIMRDVGAKVHRLKHLKLHGKMLLADEARAVIGSINLAPGSFDERRELAIETDAPEVIDAAEGRHAARLGELGDAGPQRRGRARRPEQAPPGPRRREAAGAEVRQRQEEVSCRRVPAEAMDLSSGSPLTIFVNSIHTLVLRKQVHQINYVGRFARPCHPPGKDTPMPSKRKTGRTLASVGAALVACNPGRLRRRRRHPAAVAGRAGRGPDRHLRRAARETGRTCPTPPVRR